MSGQQQIDSLISSKSTMLSHVLTKVKQVRVHETDMGRKCFSEFCHLFSLLTIYIEKLKAYSR